MSDEQEQDDLIPFESTMPAPPTMDRVPVKNDSKKLIVGDDGKHHGNGDKFYLPKKAADALKKAKLIKVIKS